MRWHRPATGELPQDEACRREDGSAREDEAGPDR